MSAWWASWLAALLLSGVVAGFMIAHCFVLGTFLTWMHRTGRAGDLRALVDAFGPPHRRRTGVYFAFYGLQFLALVAFAILAAREGRGAGLAVAAAVVGFPLWMAVHALAFARTEGRAMTAPDALDAAERARFVRWNLPLHVLYAACLTAAFLAVALVPLVTR